MKPPRPPCARCGCDWDAHQHYEQSAATYCCVCGWAGCVAYRRPRWWRRRRRLDPSFEAVVRDALAVTQPSVPAASSLRPRHEHGGVEAIAYRCGCVHFYRADGAIENIVACDLDPFDSWLKGLTP